MISILIVSSFCFCFLSLRFVFIVGRSLFWVIMMLCLFVEWKFWIVMGWWSLMRCFGFCKRCWRVICFWMIYCREIMMWIFFRMMGCFLWVGMWMMMIWMMSLWMWGSIFFWICCWGIRGVWWRWVWWGCLGGWWWWIWWIWCLGWCWLCSWGGWGLSMFSMWGWWRRWMWGGWRRRFGRGWGWRSWRYVLVVYILFGVVWW